MPTFYQKRSRPYQCYISHNLTYPSHLHKQTEIVYVLSGNISITINGMTSILIAGDTAITFPNTIHSLTTIDKSDILLIIFDIYLVDSHSNRLLNCKPLYPYVPASILQKDVVYCIHSLMEMDTSKPDYILIKGYLTVLLCRLLESMDLKVVSHDDINLVQKVLEYIDNHYTEALTLDRMSKALNTSKFYLSRIFSNKLNTSFNLYLNSRRIQLAQYLLASSELSITEVSYQSGFDSSRTFYRVFKESCGMTPREYRIMNVPRS